MGGSVSMENPLLDNKNIHKSTEYSDGQNVDIMENLVELSFGFLLFAKL